MPIVTQRTMWLTSTRFSTAWLTNTVMATLLIQCFDNFQQELWRAWTRTGKLYGVEKDPSSSFQFRLSNALALQTSPLVLT
ncbi:hypothetical protein EB796_017238 [Bugula neritina]|uniref:Uncharacterized protein n=1 Tax=Bugula neritina TaxID=10212 RepID=A0A7J7JDS6_BUGNE|nr:hypothetical protein EB796_017238 [Bugula neritina]